ncbi:hypothetical protein BJ508DRAFT_18169 [Ascobolus immersus RN42]|uniref:Uncharacterized protein n=1 Tax=Ascobolus immersus RN42 TaxID=1160509 RepID=A0A3N4HQI8_ASCIM|nr:hypothetical protein BJ508DRAFT_18169 [Ascobolus immersus RN42]
MARKRKLQVSPPLCPRSFSPFPMASYKYRRRIPRSPAQNSTTSIFNAETQSRNIKCHSHCHDSVHRSTALTLPPAPKLTALCTSAILALDIVQLSGWIDGS